MWFFFPFSLRKSLTNDDKRGKKEKNILIINVCKEMIFLETKSTLIFLYLWTYLLTLFEKHKKTLILLNCISIIISILNLLFSAPFETPTCPYCRQRITMILVYFSETERNSAELDIIDRRSQIINSVRSYNRRFSGKIW